MQFSFPSSLMSINILNMTKDLKHFVDSEKTLEIELVIRDRYLGDKRFLVLVLITIS